MKNLQLYEAADINAIKKKIYDELGYKAINESYVIETPSGVDLPTELLSSRSKKILNNLLELYTSELNHVSAKLDTAIRDVKMPDASYYVSLKAQEGRLLQLSFLLGLHKTNISDMQSMLTMNTLTYMRLERDFGTFDSWQKDMIACAIGSERFAITAYNVHLRRYMNLIVDDCHPLPPSVLPIISICVMPQLYTRDYLDDRKSYIYAMMKELAWGKIEERIKNTEAAAKAYMGNK
jgi:superoxide dismutase